MTEQELIERWQSIQKDLPHKRNMLCSLTRIIERWQEEAKKYEEEYRHLTGKEIWERD